MQEVRDASKKSEKYLAKLEKSNFMASDREEHEGNKALFASMLSLAESCINKLVSEDGSKSISNSESLLMKILGFQE